MSATDPTDRIAQLEERIAELERSPARRWPRLSRPMRSLIVIGLAVALAIPAGVVLAGGSFSDVPTSNKFYNDIEAISAADVTHGCGDGTRFCPDGLVTRGQMAAFLNRLGALAPGKTPKVNADRVDGRHANQVLRVAEMRTTTFAAAQDPGAQYGEDLTITAPTAGFVLVSATVDVSGTLCTDQCSIIATINHAESGADSVPHGATPKSAIAVIAVQGVFSVSAGANRFELMVEHAAGTDTVNIIAGTMTGIFIPFGSTGGSGL